MTTFHLRSINSVFQRFDSLTAKVGLRLMSSLPPNSRQFGIDRLRRSLLATLITVIASQPLAALPAAKRCTPVSADPAIVVFLLDTSLSVTHFDAARRAWNMVLKEAKDGDSIVLATVKGDPEESKANVVDFSRREQIPCYSILTTTEKYQTDKSAVLSRLQQAFEEALMKPRFQETLLLRSIGDIAKEYGGEPGPHVLVIASDGLEDSKTIRFKNLNLSDQASAKIIAGENTKELRAQLKGAAVWFVVAGAASTAKAAQVEQFWLTYFHTMGSVLPAHRYASDLLHYER